MAELLSENANAGEKRQRKAHRKAYAGDRVKIGDYIALVLMGVFCGLLIVTGAALGDAIMQSDAYDGTEETRTVLPGYENTVWGETAPDGSAISGYTWEMRDANVREARKNGIRVRIEGFIVDFPDQGPVLEEGRVLVPMRPVFEHVFVQCRVEWDDTANQATVYDQRGRRVVFQPGEYSYTVINSDGGERIYPLDVPAAILNGRVLLPLRALLETFASKVSWYSYEHMVDIQDNRPGWRKLMSPDEWKEAMALDCIPCSLVREAQ
jgi:hypothetical protein